MEIYDTFEPLLVLEKQAFRFTPPATNEVWQKGIMIESGATRTPLVFTIVPA